MLQLHGLANCHGYVIFLIHGCELGVDKVHDPRLWKEVCLKQGDKVEDWGPLHQGVVELGEDQFTFLPPRTVHTYWHSHAMIGWPFPTQEPMR